ncbi:hypothetical protein GCM10009733_087310 [Nonomuraea maheshkhaliensis]|uniref:Uncharacterized protein n=1 Tax=Nonomuraea maheshkhaliensis TaxID=419590 RepID=A0ABN2GU89_9ACTN
MARRTGGQAREHNRRQARASIPHHDGLWAVPEAILANLRTGQRHSGTRHTITRPGDTMTTPSPATQFTTPASAERLEKAAAALTANRFTVLLLRQAIGF